MVACTACSNSSASKEKWEGYSEETKLKITTNARAGVIAYCESLTTKQLQERSRKAGLANKGGTSVQRQWESVKANPELFAAARIRLRRTAQNFWDSLTPEERNAHVRKTLFRDWTHGRSGAGDRFIKRLIAEGIPVEAEQDVLGFVVDGLVRDRNVIVEFYGDIYHCRPDKFPDPDFFCRWLNRTVQQQWARDRKRLGVFYKHGFRVVIVWESDWKVNPNKEIQRIHDALLESRGD